MGLSVVSSSLPLRKTYLPREDGGSVYSKIRLDAGPWKLVEDYKTISLEDMPRIYERAAQDNLALMFARPNAEDFVRNNKSVTPQSVRVVLFDIEWPRFEESPPVFSPLKEHGYFILHALGLPSEELAFYIRRSSSCGVEEYEDKGKPYRFHLWIELDEAIDQLDLAESLAKKDLLDISFFKNISQPIFIQEGIYQKGVGREAFKDCFYFNQGRKVSLSEIAEFKPSKKIEREAKAKGISNGRQKLWDTYNRLAGFYGDKLPIKIEELHKIFLDYARAGKLAGNSNIDLAWLITHHWKFVGNAEKAIAFITSYPEVQRDWTEEQLERKAEDCQKYVQEFNSFGGLKPWLEPEHFEELDLRELNEGVLEKIPSHGVVLLKMAEGLGKTELVEQVFQRENLLSEKPLRFLNINYRRAPISQLAKTWGIDDYQTIGAEEASKHGLSDSKRKEMYCPKSDQLCIGIRSLPNLIAKGLPEPYDFVFIDEIEHCLEDLCGGVEIFDASGWQGKERNQIYEALKEICSGARLVIGADAKASGLGSGIFFNGVAKRAKLEKYLIANRADYIADKEVEVFDCRGELVSQLIKELRETDNIIAVHTSFGNDTWEKKLGAFRDLLISQGVKEEEVFLAYPSLWKGKEGEDTFKSAPDKVIPREIHKGKRVFICSPHLNVAWSSKEKRIVSAYALIQGTHTQAHDVKQTVRRFRMVNKINVFIDFGGRKVDDAQTEKFIERLKEGFDTLHDFKDLEERFDFLAKIKNQSVRGDFVRLCVRGGAVVQTNTRRNKDLSEKLEQAFSEKQKEELKKLAQLVKLQKDFVLLNGQEIASGFLREEPEEYERMLRYEAHKKDLKVLLMLWKESEATRFELLDSLKIAEHKKKVALLNLRLLDALDKDFEKAGYTSLQRFLTDENARRFVIEWKSGEGLPELNKFLDEHQNSLKKAFWEFLQINTVNPRNVMERLCKAFYLSFTQKNYKWAEFGLTKAKARAVLVDKYKIPKTKTSASQKNSLIGEEVRRRSKEGFKLTKEEDAWQKCELASLVIEKHKAQPRTLREILKKEALYEI